MDELQKLKAQAYDCLAALEHYQNLLRQLNAQIAELSKEKK